MKIKQKDVNGIIDYVAKISGGIITNGFLLLPENFGKGYIRFYDLGPLMKLTVIEYELNNDLTVKKTGVKGAEDIVTFSFRNLLIDRTPGSLRETLTSHRNSSVQVSSADIDIEIYTPANTKRNAILLTVQISLLRDLMNGKDENSLLNTIISGKQAYFYDEVISPEMQHIATRIFEVHTQLPLLDFYFKLKAEEMIYLFFRELIKREKFTTYSINAADVKMMYLIKEKLVSDLSEVPNLDQFSVLVNMSESKMNRLFKQIFGNTIYNHFQILRINEAAYLIREKKLSVSEAGYQLGFSNLSHFSRLFEKYIGSKPKKYSMR